MCWADRVGRIITAQLIIKITFMNRTGLFLSLLIGLGLGIDLFTYRYAEGLSYQL